MKQEALLRKHCHFRGEQINDILCGLLREEWEQGDTERPGQALYSEAAI